MFLVEIINLTITSKYEGILEKIVFRKYIQSREMYIGMLEINIYAGLKHAFKVDNSRFE